jgi:hypothetical protein
MDLSADRSIYGTEPVYERLSFCHSPDTLWGKLESAGWDWLGVKPDERTFVLGAPRRPKSGGMAALTVTRAGAVPSQFGVRVRVPRFAPTSDAWCSSEDEAREEYRQTLDRLGEPGKPALFRIELIIDGQVVEEETLVQTPSTYEGVLTNKNYREGRQGL